MSEITPYLSKPETTKNGFHIWVRYTSPATGKLKRVPKSRTGPLRTEEEARLWIAQSFSGVVGDELKALERQAWRHQSRVVQLVQDYSIQRRESLPKSAQQDLSMLYNFGIPFFISVIKKPDPNEW